MAPLYGLPIAVHDDDVEKAVFLVSAKKWASTNNDDWTNYDVLVQAIVENRQGVIHLLLEKGSRAIKRGHALQTILARMDWPSVTELLLSLGARACDRNAHGDTALHLAFVNGAPDSAINLLLAKYLGETSENLKNDAGLTLLHIACSRRSSVFAQTMIERGVNDVDQKVLEPVEWQFAGYTPLHFAVQSGQHKTAELLLRNGANIDVQDRTGSSPLHLALYQEDRKMIDLLLAHDQRCDNWGNDDGLSHLMVACAGSSSSVVENYLRKQLPQSIDSQVSASTNRPFAGFSPIHFAAKFGNIDTVRVLLNHGASCSTTTADGWSPKTFARNSNRHDILHLLRQRSARTLSR